MKKFTKIALIVASFVLVAALSVAGTLAWLTDSTATVTNTFSPTDINIELFENNYIYDVDNDDDDTTLGELGEDEVTSVTNYVMVPGANMPKNPTLRVNGGSEDCYIFVKVWAENNSTTDGDAIIEYTVDTEKWKLLKNEESEGQAYSYYYYNDVVEHKTTGDQEFQILVDNNVSVSNELTKEYMLTVKNDPSLKPALNFFGYAVQANGFSSAEAAWNATFGAPATT